MKDANSPENDVTLESLDTIVLCTGYDLSYFKFDVCLDGVSLQMSNQVRAWLGIKRYLL